MKLRKKNVARKLKKRKSIDEYKGVEKNIQRKTKSKNKLQMQEKGCASEHATVLPLICMHNCLDMHSSNMPLHICMNTYIYVQVYACVFVCSFMGSCTFLAFHCQWLLLYDAFSSTILACRALLCKHIQIHMHTCTYTRMTKKCARSDMDFIRLPTARRS